MRLLLYLYNKGFRGVEGGKFKSLNIFIQWWTNVRWKTRNSDQISLFDSAKVFIDFFLFFKFSFLLPFPPPLCVFLPSQSITNSYLFLLLLHYLSFPLFPSLFLLPSFFLFSFSPVYGMNVYKMIIVWMHNKLMNNYHLDFYSLACLSNICFTEPVTFAFFIRVFHHKNMNIYILYKHFVINTIYWIKKWWNKIINFYLILNTRKAFAEIL